MGNRKRDLTHLFEQMDILFEQPAKKLDPSKNLDDVLFVSKYIKEKVKRSIVYSQNLYAALCNNIFQRIDNPSIKWNCSWREAGEIVASIRGEGCYLDWYFSSVHEDDDKFVKEGIVTKEIENDLRNLGWEVDQNNLK